MKSKLVSVECQNSHPKELVSIQCQNSHPKVVFWLLENVTSHTIQMLVAGMPTNIAEKEKINIERV
jgi:hypothetical protein